MGGKWRPLIIYHIGTSKVIRYGGLKRKIQNINERVLTRQLRELEEHKLIKRTAYGGPVLKVEYSLTEIGQSLIPILYELGNWGKSYNKEFDYGEIDSKEETEK